MKKHIPNFDVSKVEFEEKHENDVYGTTTLYFIAPKEWLEDLFPEADYTEISVEYPIDRPEAIYATIMMSPTQVGKDGDFEDYDWFDIVMLPSEVEQLMELAANH